MKKNENNIHCKFETYLDILQLFCQTIGRFGTDPWHVNGDAPELWHERQHEDVKSSCTDPLRRGADHVVRPPAVTRVPLRGVQT